MAAMAFSGYGPVHANTLGGGANDNEGTLLDRLQATQQRLLAAEGGISVLPNNSQVVPNMAPSIQIKGRCLPGKVDLPGLVQKVNSAATQLAHRGGLAKSAPTFTRPPVDPSKYGDPNLTPLILLSPNNDIQFLMSIDGITCAHCVKIVETVLKGCPGRNNTGSPIEGLLDASADREMNAILIKIGNIAEARRIAHEAARNLSMVGYTAVARTVDIQSLGYREEMTLSIMNSVFSIFPKVEPGGGDLIRWEEECQCPDNEVMRGNCQRHQQMSQRIFEAFDKAHLLLSKLVSGCGKNRNMPCTAGDHCFCQHTSPEDDILQQTQLNDMPEITPDYHEDTANALPNIQSRPRMSMRMSLGGMLGRHSLTSNTTFGRAMSGLSALSIDWENMDDFDVNVDHSEGINNDFVQKQKEQQGNEEGEGGDKVESLQDGEEGYGPIQTVGPRTARRSSLRTPNMNANANANMNVSFDM